MANINGNNSNNTLIGTGFADTIRGRKGDDLLDGLGGNDLLLGGSGDDTLLGGLGDDTLNGGNDADVLDGGAGDDSLDGGKGSDSLIASEGNDTLNGGDGVDVAIFSGNRDDYVITQIDSVTIDITAPDGSVARVVNVESFQFADLTQTFAEVLEPREFNLAASAPTPVVDYAFEGDALNFTWGISSNGLTDAGNSHTHLVIATEPNLASVIEIFGGQDTGPLPANSAGGYFASLDTTGLADGTFYPVTYWVASVADVNDEISETNEADNVSGWTQVTVIPYTQNLTAIDLVVADASVAPGETLDMTLSILSNGNSDAGFSTAAVIIATDRDIATAVQTLRVPLDGVTASETALVDFSLNWADLEPGTYHVIGIADEGGDIAEVLETDNETAWRTITIEPEVYDNRIDAVVIEPTSDLNLGDGDGSLPGGQLDLTVTATNAGNAGETLFRIETYLRFVNDPGAGDILLTETGGPSAPFTLNYGETVQITSHYELDPGLPSTDYQIITVLVPDFGPDPGDDFSDNIVETPVTLVGSITTGTPGDDVFVGTAANEHFEGLDGDDVMTGDIRTDIFIGGAGFDIADYSGLGAGIQAYSDGPSGTITVTDFEYTGNMLPDGHLDEVEAIAGTEFDDVLVGVFTDVRVYEGLGGNDLLHGSEADDSIAGGAGDDTIGGFYGDDLIATGDGFDFVAVERDVSTGSALGHGHDTVMDFDPTMDLLIIQYYPTDDSYSDPLADLTQTAEGALLSYADDSSVLFLGLDVADLNADNIQLYDGNVGIGV